MSNSTAAEITTSFSTSSIIINTSKSSSALTTSSVKTTAATPTPTPVTTQSAAASASEQTQLITSVLTVTPSSGGEPETTTIVITSTASQASVASTEVVVTITASSTYSSSLESVTAVPNSGNGTTTDNSGGMSSSGKIAIAVVVPVVVVALLVGVGLWLWRKRKQRKHGEDLRRKEMEEYGFNPNQDPTLPAVGGDMADENSGMENDNAGYRGWGNTSNARKPSTTLSGGMGIGMALSDGGSNPDNYGHSVSPPPGTNQSSFGETSGDPLVSGRRPTSGDSGIMAAGNGMTSAADKDIQRGPSNASSAYSQGHRSDSSGDAPIPVGTIGADAGYYNDVMAHGPYGDGTYGGAQPVVRDVQARRNTRIENPTFFPQQPNAGIAQNF